MATNDDKKKKERNIHSTAHYGGKLQTFQTKLWPGKVLQDHIPNLKIIAQTKSKALSRQALILGQFFKNKFQIATDLTLMRI